MEVNIVKTTELGLSSRFNSGTCTFCLLNKSACPPGAHNLVGKSARQLNRLWAPWGQGLCFILSCIFRAKHGVYHAEGAQLVFAEWVNHAQTSSCLKYTSNCITPQHSQTSAGCSLTINPLSATYRGPFQPYLYNTYFHDSCPPTPMVHTSVFANHPGIMFNKCLLDEQTDMRRDRSAFSMSNGIRTPC